MTRLFDEVEAAFGGIDVVINAAGIMVLSTVVHLDLDKLDRMHRTNIRASFVVFQLGAQRLRSGGELVTVSSSQTRCSIQPMAPYAASKAAVEALTLSWRGSSREGTSP